MPNGTRTPDERLATLEVRASDMHDDVGALREEVQDMSAHLLAMEAAQKRRDTIAETQLAFVKDRMTKRTTMITLILSGIMAVGGMAGVLVTFVH